MGGGGTNFYHSGTGRCSLCTKTKQRYPMANDVLLLYSCNKWLEQLSAVPDTKWFNLIANVIVNV